MNQELPDVQARFNKGRGTRDQIANIHWIIEKAREFQKKSTSALLIMPKCQEAFNRRLPVCCLGSVMNPLSFINS